MANLAMAARSPAAPDPILTQLQEEQQRREAWERAIALLIRSSFHVSRNPKHAIRTTELLSAVAEALNVRTELPGPLARRVLDVAVSLGVVHVKPHNVSTLRGIRRHEQAVIDDKNAKVRQRAETKRRNQWLRQQLKALQAARTKEDRTRIQRTIESFRDGKADPQAANDNSGVRRVRGLPPFNGTQKDYENILASEGMPPELATCKEADPARMELNSGYLDRVGASYWRMQQQLTVWRLHSEGRPVRTIAAMLDLDRNAVQRTISKLRTELLADDEG